MSEEIATMAVCRLCLYKTNNCYNAFSKTLQDSDLQHKILKYMYLEIKEDDPYPNEICFKCIGRLDDFHIYCETVNSNQDVFRYSKIETANDPSFIDSNRPNAKNITEDKILVQAQFTNGNMIKNESFVVTLAPLAADLMDSASAAINYEYLTVESPAITTDIDQEFVTNLGGTSQLRPVHTDADTHTNGLDASHPKNLVQKIHLQSERRQSSRRKSRKDLTQIVEICESTPIGLPEEKVAGIEPVPELVETNLNYESDSSEYLNQYDDDVMVIDLGIKPSGEIIEDDVNEVELHGDDHQFAGFPKILIRDSRLTIRGIALLDLLSRFFHMDCDLCPASKSKTTFADLSALCQHYNHVHEIKGYVVCCGMKLIKPRLMALHMARHLQPSAFQCTICEKIMTCPKILQFHLQNHLPEDQRPHACPECPRRFSYSSALLAHSISHKPVAEREAHICDECGKSFSAPGRLATHMNSAHVNHCMDYICHICARQFTSRSNLKYHLTTHQPRIHQVQCEQCGKWLKNKLCLRKHMAQHSEVRYSCDRCDYSAVNRQCLRNHIKVHHTEVKPFSCEICDKSFKLNKTLANHMVQHTGVRKYSCEFCSRTFASSGNYYSHRKRMHPQELAAVNKQKEDVENEYRNKVLDSRI